MEKRCLKSMTDYVLYQDKRRNEDQIDIFDLCENIVHCAKFLKQQPTKGDFVPCYLEGNVLDEPKRKYFSCEDSYKTDCEEWIEAKDRVLFNGVLSAHYFEESIIVSLEKNFVFGIDIGDTFEDLILLKLELTDNAAKMLGYE